MVLKLSILVHWRLEDWTYTDDWRYSPQVLHIRTLMYQHFQKYLYNINITEQCAEGIVAISSNTLRILALEKLGAVFNQTILPLDFTPRKIVVNPENNSLIILETDHNSYTEEMKKQRR